MAYLVFFGGLGMLAGALARWWLDRLPRGASVPPPWCELLVGGLWVTSGYWWATGRLATAWLPLLLGLGWLAVAASAVDLLHRRLPDVLTLPALPAALALTVPLGGMAVWRAALGAVTLGGGYLAVRLVAPPALGAGDVKLAAPVGAVLGAASWPAVLLGALGAALLTVGAVLAVAGARSAAWALARRSGPPGHVPARWRVVVPHGPAMLTAGWLVLAAAGTAATASTAVAA
jgi:leader peptidase (prepilin peptidase)/N-methyltransferase